MWLLSFFITPQIHLSSQALDQNPGDRRVKVALCLCMDVLCCIHGNVIERGCAVSCATGRLEDTVRSGRLHHHSFSGGITHSHWEGGATGLVSYIWQKHPQKGNGSRGWLRELPRFITESGGSQRRNENKPYLENPARGLNKNFGHLLYIYCPKSCLFSQWATSLMSGCLSAKLMQILSISQPRSCIYRLKYLISILLTDNYLKS